MVTQPIIVHITNDYPDVLVPHKTNAVLSLVEGTPEYRHIVYSLNRVSAISGLAHMNFGVDKVAVAYGALPKGIFWERRLREVGQWILQDLQSKNIVPNVIEAHKFTIEGLIGQDLALSYNVPLICDIMGYTDINILHKKKSLHTRYKKIAEQAAAILPYAPWSLKAFDDVIPLDKSKCRCLPVVPNIDAMIPASVNDKDKLVSVFHLDGWKNKNFEGMALAIKKLSKDRPNITLDVYGTGSPKTLMKLQKIIDTNYLNKRVNLMGPVENCDMQSVIQRYAGFVMPSKSESYGLVYIEALFSGVPVLLNARRGISGYYDLEKIGYGCDPHDVDDIARGIAYLSDNQASLKESVQKMQESGAFEQLRKEAILKTYKSVIEMVLKG